MYPLRRLALVLLRARRAPHLSITQACKTELRCMPWDIDLFLEMNNGRILTLYDLGRFDLSVRIGLNTVLRQQGWGLVVAGSSIRYRRRVRALQHITMHTQVAAFDARWIYLKQSMWVAEQPSSSLLIRTAVTHKGKVVPTEQVKQALGLSDVKLEPEAWVQAWIDAEQQRPWPPAATLPPNIPPDVPPGTPVA